MADEDRLTRQQVIVASRADILAEDERNSKGSNANSRVTSRPADPRAVEEMARRSDLFPGRGARATAPAQGRTNMLDEPSAAGGLGSLQAQQERDERVVAMNEAGGVQSAAPGPQSERQAEASATPPETTPAPPATKASPPVKAEAPTPPATPAPAPTPLTTDSTTPATGDQPPTV